MHNNGYDSNPFDSNKRTSDELGNNNNNENNNGNKRSRPSSSPPSSSSSISSSSTSSISSSSSTSSSSSSSSPPSKVVHIRNVPMECTEGELYTLCSPFGRVVNALIMKGKGQALVQMSDQSGATALVEFYAKNPAMLRTNLIHLQYSNRDEITNKAPLQIPGMTSQQSSVPNTQEAHVLLVNVTNIVYPVTIDLLYQVFSKYGPVTKIVTFSKNGGFQAFVQFAYPTASEAAKNALDGQNIYVGCCSLRINYSNIKDLDVKYNNEKSRDFTNHYLPAGPSGAAPEGGSPYPPPMAPPYGDPAMGYPPAYPQPPPYGGGLPHAKPPMGSHAPGASQVVIASGLNEEKITPDAIFTLFGVYGDVLKVKILYTKKDTALIQLATTQQAESVITNLNGCTMYGKPIRINYSKHSTIMIPSTNSGDDNVQYTKEYVGSPHHRFKSATKTFKHICPPSATLHVSSVPQTVDEEVLRELFAQHGQVVNVKFFPSEKRMALVQMGDVDDATSALIALHNHKFENSQIPIRISFAKSSIYT